MAYEPTVWQTGDVVTAEKMNKLENGVANAGSGGSSGVMIVHETSSRLDKTWQEIHDALVNGSIAILLTIDPSSVSTDFIGTVYSDGEDYIVYRNGTINKEYSTTEPDGYPTLVESGPM